MVQGIIILEMQDSRIFILEMQDSWIFYTRNARFQKLSFLKCDVQYLKHKISGIVILSLEMQGIRNCHTTNARFHEISY